MPLFRRRQPAAPEKPPRLVPSMPGAYLFDLRSVPRHYEPLKQAIESTGEARVYFGEPLAYIRGKGVALFRVEARDLSFVEPLLDTWKAIERQEAFRFDIDLYVHNTEWVASLRGLSPDQIKSLIQERAPAFQAADA
jgi:hypothetical protein